MEDISKENLKNKKRLKNSVFSMFSNILFHKNFHLTCRCPKCGWPMCNEICAASPSHKPECEMTLARGHPMQIEVVSGKPFPLYETVAIMRCLYLKVSAPEKYKALMALEPHTEERKRNGR